MLALLWLLGSGALPARAATITVTNANDNGPGSLRQAIDDAGTGDTITFAGNYSIYLASTLSITKQMTIDGGSNTVKVSGDTNNDGTRDVQVFIIGTNGVVTLSHLSIISGTDSFGGAGVYVISGGQLTVQNSLIADNVTSGSGAGIYNTGALVVQNSTFSGNSVTSNNSGGGIRNEGTLTVENSTFSGNSAFWGGGLINNNGAILTVQNSTFSGNAMTGLPGFGGGIHNDSTMRLSNTIIANTQGGNDCSGDPVTNDHNLIEDNTCIPALNGDPRLGPLQDNGGSTWTHALLPGSPALDEGSNASCLSADQRGVSRPQPIAGVCDIGAFESRGFTLTVGYAGSGSGTIAFNPIGPVYAETAVVTLTSTPLISSAFIGWSGDVQTTINPITLTMDAPKTVTATFAIKTYVITPTAGANGSITPGTPQTVNYGASQTFTITPNTGYHILDVGVDGALSKAPSPATPSTTSRPITPSPPRSRSTRTSSRRRLAQTAASPRAHRKR